MSFNLTVDDISVIYMYVIVTYIQCTGSRMCRRSVEGWHTEDTVGHPCHKHLVTDSSLLVKISGPKTMASKILSGQLKYFEIWRKNPKSWLPDHCFEIFFREDWEGDEIGYMCGHASGVPGTLSINIMSKSVQACTFIYCLILSKSEHTCAL